MKSSFFDFREKVEGGCQNTCKRLGKPAKPLGLEYRDLTIGQATREMFAGLKKTGQQALKEKNYWIPGRKVKKID